MAKDLQWFKFYVNEWLTGDITGCSLQAQGLFSNICALYWSRAGRLSKEFLLSKFPYHDLVSELEKNNAIKIANDNAIRINFLAEQLESNAKTSQSASASARKRWGNEESDALAMPTQCQPNAIREEERREEEKREDTYPFELFWNKYKKKVDRLKSEKKWSKLTDAVKEKILKHLDSYIPSTPDPKFRKDPATYLNNESWNNEVPQKDQRSEFAHYKIQ